MGLSQFFITQGGASCQVFATGFRSSVLLLPQRDPKTGSEGRGVWFYLSVRGLGNNVGQAESR